MSTETVALIAAAVRADGRGLRTDPLPESSAAIKSLRVGLDVEASEEGPTSRPTVTAERAVNQQGAFAAEHGAGRGASVNDVDSHRDARLAPGVGVSSECVAGDKITSPPLLGDT